MEKTDIGIKMDSEVKQELSEIEKRLSFSMKELVHNAITDGFKNVESILTKLFDKDIGYIKEWQETFRGYHQIHFNAAKAIEKDITGMRNSISEEIDIKTEPIIKRLDSLEGRQLTDEVTVQVKDKILDKKDNKDNKWIAIISVLVGLAIGILGFIL